jgi:hypothetical protein
MNDVNVDNVDVLHHSKLWSFKINVVVNYLVYLVVSAFCTLDQ